MTGKWRVENLLVAGRRVSGETFAPTAAAAVRNVAARKAREFGADIAAAVATARRDSLRRVFPAVTTNTIHRGKYE